MRLNVPNPVRYIWYMAIDVLAIASHSTSCGIILRASSTYLTAYRRKLHLIRLPLYCGGHCPWILVVVQTIVHVIDTLDYSNSGRWSGVRCARYLETSNPLTNELLVVL